MWIEDRLMISPGQIKDLFEEFINQKDESKNIIISEWFSEKKQLNDKLIEFLDFRKQIKKPLKPASYKAFQRKLEKLSEWNMDIACDILEESIANGWQWIFHVKNSTLSLPKKWIAQA